MGPRIRKALTLVAPALFAAGLVTGDQGPKPWKVTQNEIAIQIVDRVVDLDDDGVLDALEVITAATLDPPGTYSVAPEPLVLNEPVVICVGSSLCGYDRDDLGRVVRGEPTSSSG